MKIAAAVHDDRLAPLFPGVDLRVFDESQNGIDNSELLETEICSPLAWGPELMRLDVGILFCSGIDRFLCGSLRGYGIEVVPDVVGTPDEIIRKWRKGELLVSEVWPADNKTGSRKRTRSRRRGKFDN